MYTFVAQEDGPVRIFKNPQPGWVYTMGSDAATGLGDDYSCSQVLTNTIPHEQVAVFRQQLPVNEYTKAVNALGRYYNEALNVCEINYPGNSVQDALLQFYLYPRNYQPEEHLDIDPNISDKFGFRTSEASKWLLINEMQVALEEKGIIIHDPVTISEMMNFVYQKEKRKAGGAAGFNDDTVIALMLAFHGAKLYPIIRPRGEAKQKAIKTDADTAKAWRLFREQMANPGRVGVVM